MLPESPSFPSPSPTDERTLEQILLALGRDASVDFDSYRRPTLHRAVTRCMQIAGVSDLETYRMRLRSDPREIDRLCREFPVHKTEFFRDEKVWHHLADTVIPTLATQVEGRQLRAWSAGCATGEEPYSLAMLLAESRGLDGVSCDAATPLSIRHHLAMAARRPFVVFATDLSASVVARASRGVYTAAAAAAVPQALRERYLVAQGDGFVVRPELRACVVFSRHDLLRQPPLCNIGLLMCRNVFMYFERPARAAVLARLRFSIRRGGTLVVGTAERSLLRTDGFMPRSLPHGTYRACDPG